MTRTSRRSGPRASASCLSETPAAMDTTRCRASTVDLISASRPGNDCGLTARTNTSLPATTWRLSFPAPVVSGTGEDLAIQIAEVADGPGNAGVVGTARWRAEAGHGRQDLAGDVAGTTAVPASAHPRGREIRLRRPPDQQRPPPGLR